MSNRLAHQATYRGWRIITLFLALLCAHPAWGGSNNHVLVVGDTTRPYFRAFGASLQAGLERGGYTTIVVDLQQLHTISPEQTADYRCIVTVGHEAAQKSAAWRLSTPILHTLVTSVFADELRQSSPGTAPRGYLLVEQPVTRLLFLASTVQTNRNRLGVLYGPTSIKYREEVQRKSRLTEFELVEKVIATEAELGDAISYFKGNADLLITLPDPVVVNEGTAKTLILGAYMGNLPLIGYSQALVKAGAMLSVYSTPEMFGAQSAALVDAKFWEDLSPSTSKIYPYEYEVSANYQVARALGVQLPSESELALQIKKLERVR